MTFNVTLPCLFPISYTSMAQACLNVVRWSPPFSPDTVKYLEYAQPILLELVSYLCY